MKRLVMLAVAALAGSMLVSAAPAAAQAPVSAQACTLTVNNVYRSALMLYAGAHLSGDCYGQVWVELELGSTASGPWQVVDATATYPTSPDAQGGTAWFGESYGCGYYRAVGYYGSLVDASPQPTYGC